MLEKKETLLSEKYQKVKSQGYLDNYERHFSNLKKSNLVLFELGIFRGRLLYMWRDYFRKGTIIGLDINPVELKDESGRIHHYQGRQQDTELLDKIRSESAQDGFDIIIDDASHLGEATKISFWHLFENHLKPGGIYVIEDWRTGYWGKWYDGKQFNLSRHDRNIRNRFQLFLDRKLNSIVKEERSVRNRSLKKSFFKRLRKTISKKRFKNHDAGMVGFVKELIDEVGMDAITNSKRGSKVNQRENIIKTIEFNAVQVFVFKKK